MSIKLEKLKWKCANLEDYLTKSDKFQGFVGLEECCEYALDQEPKERKKQRQKNKKKSEDIDHNVPNKKSKLGNDRGKPKDIVKLSNGFIVEPCATTAPSLTNDTVCNKKMRLSVKERKLKQISKIKNDIKKKPKLGETIAESASDLTPEDMLSWAEYKLQEPIMKALMELGFKKPTKIQELTLPAAIHGRRDILGAAETGSGKTLAFGLPIVAGIMRLKDTAELGLDVYDVAYKKTSVKKKSVETNVKKSKGKNGLRISTKGKKRNNIEKESLKNGCASNDTAGYTKNSAVNTCKASYNNKHIMETTTKKKLRDKKKKGVDDDSDFLEEYDVPLKRKTVTHDEDSDSDDSDNYVHLSETIDSEDLAETSDEEQSEDVSHHINDEDSEEDEDSEDDESSADDEDNKDDEDNNENDSDLEESVKDDGNDNDEESEIDEGIGCVKVIDDVEIPGHVVMKTGKPLYALILTPTRELAIQTSRHLIAVAKYTGIRVATIVGGMAAVKQERVLRSGPEIVVATPGRLWELINQGQPHLQQLDSVKFLAIDETDRMVERGHFEELQPLLERLNADVARSGSRQNFVFSATLTMVHELPAHMRGKKVTKRGKILNRRIEKMTPQQKIKRLVAMIGMTDPKVVDITTQNFGTAETLTESRITCSMDQKDVYLYYILKRHPGRTIVFCNSIGSVKRLAQLFTMLKCRPLPLHASMPQRQRLKNLERFRDDPHGVLMASDVAARGLDIPNVDHVIHYQVPRTAESYVHRSGRTARANKEGLTILMMEPSEAFLYGKLCRTLNKTSELPPFPVSEQSMYALREAVTFARSLDALALRRRKATQALGWREKAAKEMDIIIDDDVLPVKEVDSSIDKEYQAKKRQLDALLSRPLFPKGFSFKYPTLNDPVNFAGTEENALQAMKKALESGEFKKQKRKSKNAPLLKLQKR